MSPSFAPEELKPLGQTGPPVVFAPEDLKPLPSGGQAGPVVFEANQLKPLPASTPGGSGPTPGAVVDLGGPPSAHYSGFTAHPVGFKGLNLGPSAGAVLLPPAAPPRAPEPQEGLPPGMVEIEGVYFRQMPGGSLMPVGEKGLVQPMYDPVDLISDAPTGGVSGAARLAGRSMLRLATRSGLGELVRQGLRPVASAVAKGAARDAGFGALAGVTMEAVEHGTGNQVGAALAGIGAPVAAAVGPMVVRRGLAKMADHAAGSVGQAVAKAAGNQGWQASQSKLAQRLGTLSEAIGSEAYGAVARAEAQQALDATRIAAETGEYTLRPWFQTVMQGIPWLRDDRALIIGQGLRDLVNRIPGVGEALAGKLGLTNADLHQLTRLAEVIPARPLDRGGNLRLGIKDWVKDADGTSKQVWRHNLTPEAARAEVASLKPAAQKFLLAYVEPAEGFHLPPRLAPVGQVPGEGVDLGQWSLEQLAARTGTTPEILAANYATRGANGFLASFGSGDDASRVLATRALKHIEEDPSRYLKVLSYQEPDAAELLARQREAVTGGKVAGELRDTPVPTPDWVFKKVGAKPGNVYADYGHLQRKHPDQFATPEAVRSHVEYVLERPDLFLPATKPEYTLLVRQNGADKVAVVEFQLRGGKYRVRSAYVLTDGQLERKLKKAADQGGSSGPPTPARSPQEGEISSGSPTAPSDAVHLDPSEFIVASRAGEVKPGIGKKASERDAADWLGRAVSEGDLAEPGKLLRGGKPMINFAPHGEDIRANLVSFINKGSANLSDQDFVWVGKVPDLAVATMGVDPSLDLVLTRGGHKKGLKHLELSRKNYTPQQLSDAILTSRQPDEILPGVRGRQEWVFIRSNGNNTVTVVEARRTKNYLEVISVLEDPDGSYLAALRKKGNQLRGTSIPTSQAPNGVPRRMVDSPASAAGSESSIPTGSGEVKPGSGKKALDQAAGQAGDLGNLMPDDSGGPAPRLAGQVGRAATDWRAPDAVDEGTVFLPYSPRKPGQKPGGISREVNFADMVRLGVLQPNQRLQGYVTHAGTSERALAAAAEAGRLNQKAPELSLEPMVPGFARERVDALGKAPRLDEAITAYRTMGATVKAQRELLGKLGPLLLDEVPPQRKFMDGVWVTVPGNPPAKDLVRTRTEWSPWAGKMVTRQEPLSLVDVGPIEAEALGVKPGRHTIPTAFAERFEVLLGRIKQGKLDTPLEGLGAILRDLARYWKVTVLFSPATWVTNFISGGLQYGAKAMGDVVRYGLSNPRRVLDDFSAPLNALRPSMIEAVPAEILGGNVATQFGREASEFYKNVNARRAGGEDVPLTSRATGAASEALLKTTNFMLTPMGAIENYWKRSLYLSETMDWARRESKRLAAQGEQVRPQDLVASLFQRRPDLHREVMQGAVDRFGMDYDNVPTWLKRFRESLVGAATAPFPVYPYKYARTIGSHLNALNPLNRGLAPRERAARAAELIIPLSAYAAGRKYLAGGDSQVEADRERFEADYGDSGIKPDYPKLGGRDHVVSYRDYRPDPRDLPGRPSQGWDKEVFLRTAKYPYVNLSHALSGWEEAKDFGDEFKSTGPLVPLIMNLLEADMRQGPRDYPGQLGRLVSELIPAHRMVEFLAAVNDDFRKRAPKGFWEQIMLKFPGGRKYLHQPMDKWAGKLAQEERGAEWLKFLAGVNLRTVDVASAKEATSEAVARASERGLKDSQRLAFYSARTGLAPEVLEPHLDKIKQAETNGLLLYRQVERTFFGQALKAGVNALDPGQASAVNQAKRKVGREVVTHGLGARTQAQADQGVRLLSGLQWIQQNLGQPGAGAGR